MLISSPGKVPAYQTYSKYCHKYNTNMIRISQCLAIIKTLAFTKRTIHELQIFSQFLLLPTHMCVHFSIKYLMLYTDLQGVQEVKTIHRYIHKHYHPHRCLKFNHQIVSMKKPARRWSERNFPMDVTKKNDFL